MTEYITVEGFSDLTRKLQALKIEQKEAVERVVEAKSDSPEMSENKEMIEALAEQSRVERIIIELTERMGHMRRVSNDDYTEEMKKFINFGAIVEFLDTETNKESKVRIVGTDEVDIKFKDHMKISYLSPIGKALIRKKVGDFVDVVLPAGERELKILSIKY